MRKIIFGLITLAIAAMAGDVEDGLKAYENRDYFKAKKYFQKACEGENAGGCVSLGFLYELGQGVKQNKLKAKELYGRACDMGVQLGCEDYARLNSAGY
ncbi:sel1 repeat family protein [Campylobacter hyointestinalis subsp. hyointestinalis]|uniref:tetratricopeptide repeat protein n=1 Tax=Campylobacter hyointestinalis TaxID=198 RepID=UPI000726D6E2|nr:SEL1-like repeat protein [Campylobacter hyointestinalis]PPB58310.1 sel1 repeat family protein [Campylobacter hyointestinalis subsp. hyointestinalis]QCU00482.1 sel1 repeat family protein [Campylobacter hyointestinalis subsp. hyointestinalis]CUU79728.1 Hsp12 variant C [Campylobacter hyointestinalis subsp. hyointestinalis]